MILSRIGAVSRVLIILGIECLLCGNLFCQQIDTQPSSTSVGRSCKFEVISVRPREGYDRPSPLRLEWMPDGYIAEGIPLNWLAAAAYGTKIKLVTQIPSSLESKRFDIYAKVAPSDIGRFSKLSPIERNMMLRQVLEERFHVRVHMEARLSPVYDLKIIKGGPKLVASTSQKPNVSGNPKKKLIVGRNGLKAEDVAVADLANVLWNIVGRKVIDDTGLSGLYDFTLNWAPLDAQESTTESQSENPSIFQALKDQLGLELKPSRAPIDFLVVDQLEMPSPN